MSNEYVNTPAAGHALLALELNLGGGLSKALVATVNEVCDRAEDAATGSALLIKLHGGATAPAREMVDVTLVNQWERALRRLERLPLATVAAVDGPCNGLGLALLLATDYRIVTPRLRLSLALDGQEILPGMVLHRLATQIGVARARGMALFGAELDAQQTLEYGLADAVSAEPAAAAARFAGGLNSALLAGLAVRRRLVLEAPAHSYEDSLGTHLAACDRSLRAAPRPQAPCSNGFPSAVAA